MKKSKDNSIEGGILGQDSPYIRIKKLLKEMGFKEQIYGDTYLNGEISTGFYNDSGETIFIKYDMWADDEILEEMKDGDPTSVSEDEEYRYILTQVFNGDADKFEKWLLAGEPRTEDGNVDLNFESNGSG